ncbi:MULTISPECIES: type 1 glutamine amidotransferase domain-containing protein [unclassified Psychrobacter]|uniref:type 1 glutamine amidotransferase domain-containing protein n=1 Tax=unclassified Psychrobacter TaxID=196806 RepID=UPI0025B4533E|nr:MULTISPECIES: type 1 glutamine amidotransferase domain-containing protein [unclassified Psychrobacter]MDN3452380.1 type 1 glutamine amidotransferase domain-containing protein [Psychrobacter sp. APC 3350]MDN3501708.1 type 1 glutamine amidotransferase domain-containing protein [Psychrobacter sp. 5A.1]
MKTIAFLLHNNFEQAEYEEVNNQLKDKGYKTLLITTNNEKEVQAMQQDVKKGDTFTADIFAEDADVSEYDALVLPGGTVNADTIRGNQKAHAIIHAINDAAKPLAVICHAPWILINTGIAKGKTLTAYPTLQTDLENAGAHYVDKTVQTDGNLITSRNPDDITNFVDAIDKALS